MSTVWCVAAFVMGIEAIGIRKQGGNKILGLGIGRWFA